MVYSITEFLDRLKDVVVHAHRDSSAGQMPFGGGSTVYGIRFGRRLTVTTARTPGEGVLVGLTSGAIEFAHTAGA